VAGLLRSVGVEVDALMRGAADKSAVLDKIQGAAWAHFACHGDMDTNSLVLAVPPGGAQGAKEADLSMKEVQRRVRMRAGSTAVLIACNTGRGKITAEGVIGAARAGKELSLKPDDEAPTTSRLSGMALKTQASMQAYKSYKSWPCGTGQRQSGKGQPQEGLRACSACGEERGPEGYSKKQWSARAHSRKCKHCVDASAAGAAEDTHGSTPAQLAERWAGVIVEMPLLVQDAIKWEDKCDASLRSLFVSVFFCLCLLINLLITSY
jgi:hypothetical protein